MCLTVEEYVSNNEFDDVPTLLDSALADYSMDTDSNLEELPLHSRPPDHNSDTESKGSIDDDFEVDSWDPFFDIEGINDESLVYTTPNPSSSDTAPGSLIDRGTNIGIAGADVRIINTTHQTVDLQGISDHQVTDLKIVTAGAVVATQHGPVIAIFNHYAYIGTGKTIHSSIQMEECGLDVNEKPIKVPGGLQRIRTPDGCIHPIRIKDGLPYVPLRPYTYEEWRCLPHVVWTRDKQWDPGIFDDDFDQDDDEFHFYR